MAIIQYLVFVSVFYQSFAFLPNPFSAIDINDYTHTDITEIGILQVSIVLFTESA